MSNVFRCPDGMVFRILLAASLALSALVAIGADHVNPNQAEIDALNDRKALLEAQSAVEKAEAARAKDEFPAFPDGFGKTGALTIESGDRDKFHVTARTAESYVVAAKQLAAIAKSDQFVVLLSDADRNSIAVYRAEKMKLDRLASEQQKLLPAQVTTEAAGLVGIGALLSQAAQFAQLFRTNKSLAFTDVVLPDDLLLDLIAVESPQTLLYPAAALDSVYSGTTSSMYATGLSALIRRRTEIAAIAAEKDPKDKDRKDRATVLVGELDALSTALVAADATTKVPYLLTVLRGELSDGYMKAAGGRVFSVRIAAKGGASLKTSSIWRSDRLYASGGIVATYRLTGGDSNPRVMKAGVITFETKFVKVPLSD